MNFSLFLRLGRVSNLPTVWTNVLAAAVLSGATLALDSVALLCASFSLFYVGGMFLNDAFDAEFDKLHRKERPIPRGEIERSTVFVMGGAMLVLGVMTVALHGMLLEGAIRREPMLYALALCACILWYNADHQQNFLGPVLMGLNRVYVYATTAFVLQPEPDVLMWYGCGALLSYLIGLTFLAQQESHERVGSFWPVIFLALPLAYPAVVLRVSSIEANWTLVGGVLLGLVAWVVRSIVLLRPKTGAPRVKSSIVSLIAGISLLDALGCALLDEGFYVLLSIAGFALCLVSQKAVSGT